MPLLNDASAVYLGGSPVDAVYAGDVKVWPSFGGIDAGPWTFVRSSPQNVGEVWKASDKTLRFLGPYPPDVDGREWIRAVSIPGRWLRLVRVSDQATISDEINVASEHFGNWRIGMMQNIPDLADGTSIIIEVWEDQP